MRTPHRVLVVEDNSLNRKVAESLVKCLGHDVRVVDDGRQALEAFSQEAYDLVLMDCQMPGLDGFEATRRLRQRGILVPIIAFTAMKTAMIQARCLAVGMDDFLPKPCRLAELEAVLERWLRTAVSPPSGGPRSGG